MEWIGWLCLVILMFYSSYPGKVDKLEKKVKTLGRKEKGELNMSKIISSLVGEKCKIEINPEFDFNGSLDLVGEILDVDDEWIKISFVDKKDNTKVGILRIESINNIELISE